MRFAADVFHDLHEQVITTSARGRKVLTRVQNIEAALPSLEKAVKNQKSHIHFTYVPEQALDTKPTVVPHENGHDKLSNINLQKLSNTPLHTRLNGTSADDLGDDLKQSSLLDDMTVRSPSVKWDEKAEITMSTTSVYCDDVVMDKAEHVEAKCISPEQQEIDNREMESLEQQEALHQKAKLLLVLSGLNHHDEVPSEIDNYVDALNTLESETDTEPELQTKSRVAPVPSLNVYVPHVELVDNVVAESPDSSVAEFLDSQYYHAIQLFLILKGHLLLLIPLSPDDTTGDTFVMSQRRPQDYPRKVDDDKVESGGTVEVSNSQPIPLNGSLENGCATQGLPTNAPTNSTGVSSVKLWTNAGLFGLEPSKPPVFGAHDGPKEDTTPGYKEPQLCHSTGYTELHFSKPTESAQVDVPNGNVPVTSSFVGKLVGICPGSASHTISEANQSTVRTPDTVIGQTEGSSGCSTSFEHSDHKNSIGKQTSISELLESEDSAENGAEMYSKTGMDGRNDMNLVSASSFSSIAQRFLANTLQRRTPKYTDLPISSVIVNTDANDTDESTQISSVAPSETAFKASPFEKKTENDTNGLPKSSLFSSCHYSEKSSPPLEYMKISFHPMSAFEMSKLDLDFSDGNLHENADDMMLPTFQLLPGSSVPQPGSGSESEDDTFGRSYSYSSYDDLSPRLYSNSELWDQEDAIGLEDHDMHNDPNQTGSFGAPISSFVEFEQMDLSGAKSTVSLVDLGDDNGLGTLNSHPAGELPNFDTLMATNNHQNEDAFIPLNPEEHLPPIAPPDQQGHAKEDDRKVDVVKEMSNPPNIEIRASLLQQIRDKSGQQKLNGHEKSKAVGNDTKNLDEREELLQQIRSKTFNLRRTNASKTNTSSPSTANSNVVAILEKANAIRQAVASDEGGDDDNWSDI
ncbi:hypothetical protein E2562_014956 [Oryza meyeriana var. granulata]|uniref:Protein SCAR n=1 Tax=Oryza meyeriana var. granulata TaxID=110450 RepID=A0A6G1EKD5_9ORYZ|nr:hypothetical protein E2562_014956 [Oryza meyeriana var. granulata]